MTEKHNEVNMALYHLAKLMQYCQTTKIEEVPSVSDTPLNISIHLIRWIELLFIGISYELAFPEQVKKRNGGLLVHLKDLPNIEKFRGKKKVEKAIWIYKKYNNPKHPIAVDLYYMDCIPEIRDFEKEYFGK